MLVSHSFRQLSSLWGPSGPQGSKQRRASDPCRWVLQDSKLTFPGPLFSRETPGAEKLCRIFPGPVSVGELVGALQGGLPGTDCNKGRGLPVIDDSKGRCLVYSKQQHPPARLRRLACSLCAPGGFLLIEALAPVGCCVYRLPKASR